MSLEDTLERAAQDVERGDLGKARDRLEGLLGAYPDQLTIRERLGDIYWRLQYPERAGKYWYLFESTSPDMDSAKSAFESRYGSNAWLMLDALSYHGGPDAIEGTYAASVIRDLAERAGLTPARLEAVLRRRDPGELDPLSREPWWVRLVPAAATAILLFVLLFSCIGVITAVESLKGLLAR